MSAQLTPGTLTEFSIELLTTDVPPNGTTVPFEANESQRAALALRFDLLELRSFKGKVGVKPWRRHGLSFEGQFEAELVQACIATLEPIEAKLSEAFSLHFLPAEMIERDAAAAAEREIVVDVQSEDPPEPIENGRIDIGETMSELLAVAIDPYPKKPGATFTGLKSEPEPAEEKPANPFAALEKLKKKD